MLKYFDLQILTRLLIGFVSVLASHVAFSIPIVVLMIFATAKEMNDDMIKAAYDLGASQVQMLKGSHAAISDTSDHCWLLYSFHLLTR